MSLYLRSLVLTASFVAAGPGVTLCVESYRGPEKGEEGVKLEQQVLITETSTRLLSQFPFEDVLLA